MQIEPKETVLVVGNKGHCKAHIRILHRFGYQVLEASDDLEARRLADAHGEKINLLLTDFSQRETDGLNLARWFRSRFPKMHILITTAWLWDLLCNVNEQDEFGVLVWPFNDLELGRTVQRLTAKV